MVYQLQRHFVTQNLDLIANSLATGVCTEENSSRIPDIVICSQKIWEDVLPRSGAGVLDFPEKPLVVVEIVSTNRRDDYVIKRYEYKVAEIPEYWIVDPKKQRVRVYTQPQDEESYNFTDFTEESVLISSQFPQLELSVKELLNPPLVEELMRLEQAKIKSLEQEAHEERQRAETERQRAETERQRAEKLAQRLQAMGVNLDEIE